MDIDFVNFCFTCIPDTKRIVCFRLGSRHDYDAVYSRMKFEQNETKKVFYHKKMITRNYGHECT